MRAKLDKPDLGVAEVAEGQHGVVTRGQLLALGLSASAIERRVQMGRLHRLHRGVYAVGHRSASRESRWMAAVLACGEGAVLSHASAAALWDLLRPHDGPVDVSVPTRAGRAQRPGIRLHRRLPLPAAATARRLDIPVTAPAQTIEDLRGHVPPRWWRRAVRQAELAGYRLGPGMETDRTRSDLERDFLRICRRADLPRPEVNVRLGRWTVDFLWRRQRLAVEADSYLYHRGRIAFQDDRARDLDLRRAGFEVRRFSEQQIDEEPNRVAADLAKALGGRPRDARPRSGSRHRGR